MTINYKGVDEKAHMILTEKQQKHQNYSQVKLININILQARKAYDLNYGSRINGRDFYLLIFTNEGQEKLKLKMK